MSSHYPLNSIEPVTVADQVYLLLERDILSGRISGGSRLRVRQLAERVGTSIMPVRDAIRRLERSGLVLSEPNKGAWVKEFNTREFADVYAVRLLLEPEAAALGARRASEEVIAEMSQHLQDLQQAVDEHRFGDAIEADSALLRALYDCTGNDFLRWTIDSSWKHCYLYRVTSISSESENRTLHWNARLLEAVRAHDDELVRECSRRSIESAIKDLEAYEPTTQPVVRIGTRR